MALDGAIRNLHALWDDAITAKFRLKGRCEADDGRIREVATSVEGDFPMASLAEESYALAVDSAYDGLTPQTRPTDAYRSRWTLVAEHRVALAGYRLADFLNRLVAGKVKA